MTDNIVSIAPHLATIEFDCEDCGTHVSWFAPFDHLPVCHSCRFLRTLKKNGAESSKLAELRTLLGCDRQPDDEKSGS